jgi:hypothetical protein
MVKPEINWFETDLANYDADSHTYEIGSTDKRDFLVPVVDLDAVGPRMVIYETPTWWYNQPGQTGPEPPEDLPEGFGELLAPWEDLHDSSDSSDAETYSTGEPLRIHLPFVYHYREENDDVTEYLAAMKAMFGSMADAEQLMLRAESYVGNTVEILNLTGSDIEIYGIAQFSNNVLVRSPWQSMTIGPQQKILATCVRSIKSSSSQHSQTDPDYIYWELQSYLLEQRFYSKETFNSLGVYDIS